MERDNSGDEKAPIVVDDGASPFDYGIERLKDAFMLDNLRLIERYNKRQIHILIHFRIHGYIGSEFVASFQRLVEISEDRSHVSKIGDAFARTVSGKLALNHITISFRDAAALVAIGDGKQKAVLVDNV
jgi:hypothetical protein